MKKHLSAIITLGFLGLFVWYGVTHQNLFGALTDVALWTLLLVVAGKLLLFLSNGLFVIWTAEAFTKKMNFGQGVFVTILSAVGNFFGSVVGGIGVRALYLKKYHGLPYSKFTSTLIGYYLLMFMFNSLLAVGSLLLLARTQQTGYLLAFFAVWFAVFFGLAFVRLPARQKLAFLTKNKVGRLIYKALYDIEEGWRVLLSNKRLLAKMAGLSLMSLVAIYFTSLVEFYALGIDVSWAALGLYTALVQVAMLLSITPGAIGIREAILVIIATTMGITGQEIIQVAIIDRGVHFLLLGVLFLLIRNSKIKRSLVDSQSVRERHA